MPSYEQSLSGRHSAKNFYSFDKILATMELKAPSNAKPYSTLQRMGRVNVSIKDTDSFYETVQNMSEDQYYRSGAVDLSALFMPFTSAIGPQDGMPGLHAKVEKTVLPNKTDILGQHILPFEWQPDGSNNDFVVDRYQSPSGDGIRDILSGDRHYGDINQFRDKYDVRGIGLRLPIMGVGWGYTLNTGQAMPSGTKEEITKFPTGTKVFKGGTTEGWQVDPADYIAAPIDFRYDERRHVWTCGGEGLPPGSGIYKVLTLVTNDNPGKAVWDYIRFPPEEPI